MRKVIKNKYFLVLLMVHFIVMNSTFFQNAFASDQQPFQTKNGLNASNQQVESKINKELEKEFSQKEYVTYLVKFVEQVDTKAVSEEALQLSMQKKHSKQKEKIVIRNHIVSALRETSNRTQANVKEYLSGMVKEGKVKEFKSFFIVNSMVVTSTKEVMEEISKRSEIEKVLPNRTHSLGIQSKKTEPSKMFPEKAPVESNNDSEEEIEWNIRHVQAPQVWDMGIDGSGIVVANIDTGVDLTHPTLQRKWRGYDANGEIVSPELSWYDAHSHYLELPFDGDGHGTHAMGTIAGSREDGTKKIGVAPGVKWIAVRAFNPTASDAVLLDAGQWILAPVDKDGNVHPEMAPDIVNNSWGSASGFDEWYRPMVQAWRDAQILPVFAAGNLGEAGKAQPGTIANPANYPESFAVGAVNSGNQLADFSLRGPSPYNTVKPNISAPGVSILSAVPGWYDYMDGTSMAAPHISGVAALMLQADAGLRVDEIEDILTATAMPLTNSDYPDSPNNGFGSGLVDAYGAVTSIFNGIGSVEGKVETSGKDTEPPTYQHDPITFSFSGADLPISIEVTDNMAVEVKAYAKKKSANSWTVIPLTRISGNHLKGTYSGLIPYSLLDSSGLEYYFELNDPGKNKVDTEIYHVEISNGITPGYFQDFEDNMDHIKIDGKGRVWTWGIPQTGPGKAFSGEKVLATNVAGLYGPNMYTSISLPPIDLLDADDGAILSFKHWFSIEQDLDFGRIYLASEKSGYEYLPIAEFTGKSNGWESEYIDLRAYAGQQIFVMIVFDSDFIEEDLGWFIDDLAIMRPDKIPPNVPINIRSEVNALGETTLSWNDVEDEYLKGYAIYRGSLSGDRYIKIGSTKESSFKDKTTEFGKTYYYVITAIDGSFNESGYSKELKVVIEEPTVLFFDDFEGKDDNGWTHDGLKDEWERGTPVKGPGYAYSGTKVWATDLDENYELNAYNQLVSPVIDLTEVKHAALSFYQWYDFEPFFDFGRLQISKDNGKSWQEIKWFTAATFMNGWTKYTVDLESFVGNQIQVRFRLESGPSVTALGWYLDDFKVVATTEATPDIDVQPPVRKPRPSEKVEVQSMETLQKVSRSEIESLQKNAETPSTLPVNAYLSVLETGRGVKTDPFTGEYRLVHMPGDYTIRAEAYGYYPSEAQVAIIDGETSEQHFSLEKVPHGMIKGKIINEKTGEPVSNAYMALVEDAQVTPVWTKSDGTFELTALEGDYTLSISKADYYTQKLSIRVVGGENVVPDVSLKPFLGMDGMIAYDDGSAEDASAFFVPGFGWGVKMTPETPITQVKGAKFFFWTEDYPSPGGTQFEYAVYDARGFAGAPGKMLAGPFKGVANRNGDWTEVTLPQPILVEGDFYIAYFQPQGEESSPAIGLDLNAGDTTRTWMFAGGEWFHYDSYNNEKPMIRALVDNEVSAPVITYPTNHYQTNKPNLTLKGSSIANGGEVLVYNSGKLVERGIVENKTFQIPVDLEEGVNEFTVDIIIKGENTGFSNPVTVVRDSNPPKINLELSEKLTVLNNEIIKVKGTLMEKNLDKLVINNQQVEVGTDGKFEYKFIGVEGLNRVEVHAVDLAGNKTELQRDVEIDLTYPTVTNFRPFKNLSVKPGGPLTVSFEGEKGLKAGFYLTVPENLPNSAKVTQYRLAEGQQLNLENIMVETSNSEYMGKLTIPSDLKSSKVGIVIIVSDPAGNTTEYRLPVKLTITDSNRK
jgi:bacillopeptidase F (M6 metalloprotease family)/subtilisin family serine protease